MGLHRLHHDGHDIFPCFTGLPESIHAVPGLIAVPLLAEPFQPLHGDFPCLGVVTKDLHLVGLLFHLETIHPNDLQFPR